MWDTIYKFLLSSQGDGMSLRVKSFLIGLAPVIVLISNLMGSPIVQEDIDILIFQIVNVVSAFGTIVSAGFFIFGWARAKVFKAGKLGKYAV
jgi:hypothetical protein